MSLSNQEEWKVYCEQELSKLQPLLDDLAITLEDEQPHISGERFLMRAATGESGSKLILLGRQRADGSRVVIKATRSRSGRCELEHQRICQVALEKINFAYTVFNTPKEILFTNKGDFTISVHEFIEQDMQFIDRSLEDQFTYALKAFKAQESAHATTFKHRSLINSTFGSKDSDAYIFTYTQFSADIHTLLPAKKRLHTLLEEGKEVLERNSETIEQYSSFLTHIDFVPHNFRIADGKIFLLDHSSLCFGNKHEGWARFINFMELYNRELAHLLVEYIRDNKTPEESVSLYLMRIYRLAEIVWYYADKLDRSSGSLLELNKARIDLYTEMLSAVLKDDVLSQDVVEGYKKTRDELRSEDEKRRQVGLH